MEYNFPVLDGGTTQIGLESTVLDITTEPLTIYRPGEISKEKIEKITGRAVQLEKNVSENEQARSPGTKYSHYAPEAAVQWFGPETKSNLQNALYLFHTNEAPELKSLIHYQRNYHKMAGELYDRFRQADIEGYEKVIIEPLDQQIRQTHPITEALHNRISKALSKHRSS
ncbi:MAG: Sua5 family C-terminal domain-containing protein [Balneolaceae bacterium]|nr:Sua5 family C-terminal domain-containing protein [Balneolaceae bacterium]